MLDQQDIEVIKTIVKDETSDIRQDVSILKQGQKDLFSYMNVLHENMKSEFKLVVENLGSLIKEALTPVQHRVYDNHENRITRLEVAFTKNMAGKKKKSA